MKRTRRSAWFNPFVAAPFATGSFAAWSGLTQTASDMLLASAQVIGHRTQRMAKAKVPLSARDQREFTRMGAEKVEAAVESAQNLALDMMAFQRQAFEETTHQILGGKVDLGALMKVAWSPKAARSAKRAIKPFHRRAKANAHRLSKA